MSKTPETDKVCAALFHEDGPDLSAPDTWVCKERDAAGIAEHARSLELDRNRLRDENAELEKDAERYRWLRDNAKISGDEPYAELPSIFMWESKRPFNERFESLNAAIDAALAKSREAQ